MSRFSSCAGHLISTVSAVLVISGFLAGGAYAGMSYYIDDHGAVVFVDDPSLIPDRYKDRKGTIDAPMGGAAPAADRQKSDSPKQGGDTASDERDKSGNTPSFWRTRYKETVKQKESLENDIRELESQRTDLGRQLDTARSKAFFVGDGQSLTQAAMLENKAREIDTKIKIMVKQVDDLNRMISTGLPEEIMRAGGKPQWLLND